MIDSIKIDEINYLPELPFGGSLDGKAPMVLGEEHVSECLELIGGIVKLAINQVYVCSNKRVRHLSQYGKTMRIRKKNRKRIFRGFEYYEI